MLKLILIISVVLVFGVSVAAAQPLNAESCDPYQLEDNGFSIDSSALTAPAANSVDAFAMQQIGINPDVLVQIADNVNGIESNIADFANPQTQLVPRYSALVTPEGNSLKVYEGTCTEAAVLAQLQTGTRVTVLDGPIAAEGMAWWRVRRENLTGWVIEGEGSEIWLQGMN